MALTAKMIFRRAAADVYASWANNTLLPAAVQPIIISLSSLMILGISLPRTESDRLYREVLCEENIFTLPPKAMGIWWIPKRDSFTV